MSERGTASDEEPVWAELVALGALGVLPADEAGKVRAHLRACEKCAIEYQHHRAAADLLGAFSEEDGRTTVPARPERLKTRVLGAARAAREPKSKGVPQQSAGYAHLVKSDAFVDFRPGVKWAVINGAGVTLIQWVFEPPECGEIPDELHSLTQSGVVLEGSYSMHYTDGTIQRLRKHDVYMVAPGTVHGAEFHERTVLFDIYTPNHTEFEELYLQQLSERDRRGR